MWVGACGWGNKPFISENTSVPQLRKGVVRNHHGPYKSPMGRVSHQLFKFKKSQKEVVMLGYMIILVS